MPTLVFSDQKLLSKSRSPVMHNSFTTKKHMSKFSSANFQKLLSPSYIVLRNQRLEGKQVDLDEVAHFEPPHLDLCCLQIPLFSSPVLEELRHFVLYAVCLNMYQSSFVQKIPTLAVND